MSTMIDSGVQTPFASLQKFARKRPVDEYCHLCRAPLRIGHAHLLELSSRQLCCSCEACALLFSQQGAARYRRVPNRADYLIDFQLNDAEWEQLHLPINLAFFMRSTTHGRVIALYPSPAGTTESLPAEEAWDALVAKNPILAGLEPDVEALLINRLAFRSDCYIVGIDECYKLAGMIRIHWRGLSGGAAVWKEIGRFFVDLKRRCHAIGATNPA